MIVDVTYNNMTFQESVVDCIRRVDAIIHEAEMGVMIDKYMYLQENGVVLEGDQAKTSIRNRIRSMVYGVVRAFINFIESVKKKLIGRFNAIKAKHDQKKAAKIDKVAKKTAKTFDRVSDKFSNDMEEFYDVVDPDDNDFNEVAKNIEKRHHEYVDAVNNIVHNMMDTLNRIDDNQVYINDILDSISDEFDDLTKD